MKTKMNSQPQIEYYDENSSQYKVIKLVTFFSILISHNENLHAITHHINCKLKTLCLIWLIYAPILFNFNIGTLDYDIYEI